MPRLHELDLVLGPVQGTDHAIDTVPRVAEDAPDPPFVQPVHQEIASGLAHVSQLLSRFPCLAQWRRRRAQTRPRAAKPVSASDRRCSVAATWRLVSWAEPSKRPCAP